MCTLYMHIIHNFNHKNLVKSDTAIKSGCMGKAKKKKNLSMEAHWKTDKKKYHLGLTTDMTERGSTVHLGLIALPTEPFILLLKC